MKSKSWPVDQNCDRIWRTLRTLRAIPFHQSLLNVLLSVYVLRKNSYTLFWTFTIFFPLFSTPSPLLLFLYCTCYTACHFISLTSLCPFQPPISLLWFSLSITGLSHLFLSHVCHAVDPVPCLHKGDVNYVAPPHPFTPDSPTPVYLKRVSLLAAAHVK